MESSHEKIPIFDSLKQGGFVIIKHYQNERYEISYP